MTKEDIIKQINECDIQRIKLIGKLELLDEQSKEQHAEVETSIKEATSL